MSFPAKGEAALLAFLIKASVQELGNLKSQTPLALLGSIEASMFVITRLTSLARASACWVRECSAPSFWLASIDRCAV